MKTKISVFFIGVILMTGLQVLFCNKVIVETAKDRVFSQSNDLPDYQTVLVLGTSKYLMNGHENLYFKNRIDKTIQLYKSGRVKCIIVSGDNGSSNYDEPTLMKNDLIKQGVPAGIIICDYAGFRTLDSVVRAKSVFGYDELVIVSQKFHLERALYLSVRNNIKAVGLTAEDVPQWYDRKGYYREKLARVKAVFDVCILNKQPKFLGEEVSIKNSEELVLEM